MDNFECKCCRDVKSQRKESIKLDGDNLEVVDKSCYLGDMLNSEGSVHDAVIARLRVGWGKFKEIGLPSVGESRVSWTNKHICLNNF